MAELDGLTLIPLVNTYGVLTNVRVQFKDAPGMELMLTATAATELRDGLSTLLNIVDWTTWDAVRNASSETDKL